MAEIKDKVAIITGSGGGIGGAIALRYAREGAKLALADIDAKTGESRAAEISSMGCDAFAIVADVTDKKSVQEMVHKDCRSVGTDRHFSQCRRRR
jgi:3-hydroxybutyrate dehydrogenase